MAPTSSIQHRGRGARCHPNRILASAQVLSVAQSLSSESVRLKTELNKFLLTIFTG